MGSCRLPVPSCSQLPLASELPDNNSPSCWRTPTPPQPTMPYDVDEEVALLVGHIKRLATDGESVTFEALFDDDGVANSLESLAGTLKAAKRKGKVNYGPELLLQGMSDSVVITLTGK